MKRYKIKFINDSQYKEYHKDDIGYIDGYIQGADGIPYAVIRRERDNRMVMADLFHFVVIGYETGTKDIEKLDANKNTQKTELKYPMDFRNETII